MGGPTTEGRSDGDLVEATRTGDSDAYAELWRRHAAAGTAFAHAFTARFDADDLVAEAYARILGAIRRGGGPHGAFRPYLYSTIRNTAVSWLRTDRTEPVADAAAIVDRGTAVTVASDRSPALDAFLSLPTPWQEVLWYVDVEGLPASEVAPLLGASANAVAARTYRARAGLREAWLRDRVGPGSEHEWTLLTDTGKLSLRDRRRMRRHLDACPPCRDLAAESAGLDDRLGAVLLPALTGLCAATLPSTPSVVTPSVGTPSGAVATARLGRHAGHGLMLPVGVAAGVVLVGAVLAWAAADTAVPAAAVTPRASSLVTSTPTPTVTPSPTVTPTPTAVATPYVLFTPSPKPRPVVRPTATAAAAAPASAASALRLVSPSGPVLTDRTTLPVSGTAPAGAAVVVTVGTTPVGTTTAGPDGSWSVTADLSGIGDGSYPLTVTADQAQAGTTVTVDRTPAPPAITGSVTGAGKGIAVTGTAEPGATVRVTGLAVDVTVTADGTGRWTTPGLGRDLATVRARQTDPAGNVSGWSGWYLAHR